MRLWRRLSINDVALACQILLLPHKLECDDQFWQVLDAIHPLSLALSSWASSCEEEVREECQEKSQEAAFLFACAKAALALKIPLHQRSALLLLRQAAGLAADSTWTGHRSHEEVLPCLHPATEASRSIDQDLLDTELKQGRQCRGGSCREQCGLLVLDDGLHDSEISDLVRHAEIIKDLHGTRDPDTNKLDIHLHLSAHHRQGEGHLLFLYVLEKLRRLIALAANVPPSWVSFASHFLSHLFSDESAPSKGTIHCDESSFDRFHYSAVLWLTAQNSTTGGEVQFYDSEKRDWRVTVQPIPGRLAIFTSGWENIHRVTPLLVGERWSLPVFASVKAPLNTTRISKACLWPASSKQWEYCQDRLDQWLGISDAPTFP
ncbi:Ogfod3, partial [Symbiodinium sp. KB8]